MAFVLGHWGQPQGWQRPGTAGTCVSHSYVIVEVFGLSVSYSPTSFPTSGTFIIQYQVEKTSWQRHRGGDVQDASLYINATLSWTVQTISHALPTAPPDCPAHQLAHF